MITDAARSVLMRSKIVAINFVVLNIYVQVYVLIIITIRSTKNHTSVQTRAAKVAVAFTCSVRFALSIYTIGAECVAHVILSMFSG